MSETKKLKINIIGDGVVGKTCLLVCYTEGKFPEEYVPTVFENYIKKISVDGLEYDMTLWDTAGQEDYERLRPLSYPNTDCFIVCFSVDSNSASYANVATKWVPELKHYQPHTPFVLVATKTDLRDDPGFRCYTTDQGKSLRRKVKAHAYVECSAKRSVGIEEVFVAAIRASRDHGKKKKKKRECKLL